MNHSFNVDIAKKFGIEEAVIVENIYFWISVNGAEDRNLHNGRYWTYNSQKGFASLFTYMTENVVRRALENLCNGKKDENGEYIIEPILVKDDFNENKMSKKKWYAFNDNGIELLRTLNYDVTHLFSDKSPDLAILPNGHGNFAKSIADNNTNNKQKKEIYKEKENRQENDTKTLMKSWNEIAAKIGLQKIVSIKGKRKNKLENLYKTCGTNQEELTKLIEALPYADDWVLGKSKTMKWKIDFDWLINNTSNWYVRALEGGMHTQNKHEFDIAFNSGNGEYVPSVDGFNLRWLENEQIYMSFYDIEMLADGYTKENRPASARVRRGMTTYHWSVETKNWEVE